MTRMLTWLSFFFSSAEVAAWVSAMSSWILRMRLSTSSWAASYFSLDVDMAGIW